MKIHEYQAKALFREAGIAVPAGSIATTPEEAAAAWTLLAGSAASAAAPGGAGAGAPPGTLAVVKAQIHAGGRGKGGGVKLVRSAEEARAAAAGMLGKPLVTHQTGPGGQLVRTLLVEAGSEIAHEYYVGLTVDRSRGAPVLMVSTQGGMDIEHVAATTPELILKEAVDPEAGLRPWQARRLAYALGFPAPALRGAMDILVKLVRLFLDKDCALVEINPLVVTKSGGVLALDGKINFDANALYRHKDIVALRDIHEEDPREVRAAEAGLQYIALDGTIGCLVNGAGLAMGTMDTIQLAGGAPANFLDVGGGASKEQVTAAFRLILSDANVRAILVNIFGGIMKCDVIAEGIITAARETAISVPLVVRLEGTNVARGRQLLEESGIDIITAGDLADAAAKAVQASSAAAAGVAGTAAGAGAAGSRRGERA